ncbi:MAG: hypothetical protein ACTSXT_10840, partial [Candidatus Helarchaeota archaeon]
LKNFILSYLFYKISINYEEKYDLNIIIIIAIGSIAAVGGTTVYYKIIRPTQTKRVSKKDKFKNKKSNLTKISSKQLISSETLKNKYGNVPFTISSDLSETNELLTKIDKLDILPIERTLLMEELSQLPAPERKELLKRLLAESAELNQKKFINNLLNEIQELEKTGKLSDTLKKIEIVLEIADIEGYQVIFEKLLQKYKELQKKTN